MSRNGPRATKLNRRQYLKKTTAAAGALCLAPTIIPARALGETERPLPASGSSWPGSAWEAGASST